MPMKRIRSPPATLPGGRWSPGQTHAGLRSSLRQLLPPEQRALVDRTWPLCLALTKCDLAHLAAVFSELGQSRTTAWCIQVWVSTL